MIITFYICEVIIKIIPFKYCWRFPDRVGINTVGEIFFLLFSCNTYFLRVIFRKYSVCQLTCSDWVSCKTRILWAVLMIFFLNGRLLSGLARDRKNLPPSGPFNHCEIRNKLFFKASQEKNKIKTSLPHDFFSCCEMLNKHISRLVLP